MVYTADLKSALRKQVRVQVPLSPNKIFKNKKIPFGLFPLLLLYLLSPLLFPPSRFLKKLCFFRKKKPKGVACKKKRSFFLEASPCPPKGERGQGERRTPSKEGGKRGKERRKMEKRNKPITLCDVSYVHGCPKLKEDKTRLVLLVCMSRKI